MATIFPRAILPEIRKYLDTNDVVVLHGARQVGKTHILYALRDELRAAGRATHYIDLEDSRFVRLLDSGVGPFLDHLSEEGVQASKGEELVFVFIDEIQYLADPSSFLKLVADHHRRVKLIVSGSSSFAIRDKFRDSLVGRTVDFEIFPLRFEEFLVFKGRGGEASTVRTAVRVDELRGLFREFVLYGGYPKVVLTPEVERKEKYLQQIIDTYVRKDIRDLARIADIGKFNRLVEALASQSGQLLNVAEVSSTIRLAKPTVERHLFLLENTYILRLVRPFSGNVRSELTKMPKVFFFDTGLMQMLWLKGLQKEVLGPVFETAVFAELVKRYGRESVLHWRTKDRREIDFVVRDRQRVLPIEAKVRYEQFSPAACRFFAEKYEGAEPYRVVALEGVPADDRHSIRPWEL